MCVCVCISCAKNVFKTNCFNCRIHHSFFYSIHLFII